MKIVHVITSLKIGGAESLLVDLVDALESEGHTNSVLYFYDGPNREKLVKAGIPVYSIKKAVCLYDPFFLWQLFYTLKKIKPDVVHSWLWSANILSAFFCALLKIPQLSSIHSVFNQTAHAKDSKVRTWIENFFLRYSSKIIFVSQGTQDLFLKSRAKNSFKTTVITNGIKPAPVAKRHKQTNEFLIAAVGRFIPLKNHSLLIDVFYELQQRHMFIKLMLIGYGPLEEQLRAKVTLLHLEERVNFIKTDKPYDYLMFADCFVMPSDQEGLSIALLEAMAMGVTPVVTSTNGKHDAIIHNEHGLIAETSIKSISNCIENLIADSSLNNTLGHFAQKRVQDEFNFESMVCRYVQAYKSSLNT